MSVLLSTVYSYVVVVDLFLHDGVPNKSKLLLILVLPYVYVYINGQIFLSVDADVCLKGDVAQ